MFQFKGTIIRPNMETQFCYIQRVHIAWDILYLFTIVNNIPYCLQYHISGYPIVCVCVCVCVCVWYIQRVHTLWDILYCLQL